MTSPRMNDRATAVGSSFLTLEPAQVLNVVCMMRKPAVFPTKTHADARVTAKCNSDTQHNHGLRRSILPAFRVGAIKHYCCCTGTVLRSMRGTADEILQVPPTPHPPAVDTMILQDRGLGSCVRV